MIKRGFKFNLIYLSHFLFVLAFLVSCEDVDSEENIDYSKEVSFNISEFNEKDSGVEIKWNSLENRTFVSYDIIRYSSNNEVKDISTTKIYENGTKISSVTKLDEISFTDSFVNDGNIFFYYIVTVNFLDENNLTTTQISTDYKTYIRQDLLINLNKIVYSENGETIFIEWENSVPASFVSFELYRLETNYLSDFNAQYIIENGTKVETFFNENNFTDTNISFNDKFYIYALKINTKEFSYYTQNYLFLQNNLFFDFKIQKMLSNPEKPGVLLLIEDSFEKIHEYSLNERKISNTLTLETKINEPLISDGELYLPTMDGNIYIYDAITLNQIDIINLNEERFIHSLVKKNDIIFYTEAYNLSYGYYIGKAINRITKEEVLINNINTPNNYYYNNNPTKFLNGKDDFFLAVKSINNFSVTDIVNIKEISSVEVNLQDTFDGSVYEDIGYEIFDTTDDFNSFISSNKAYHYQINYDVIIDGESTNNKRFTVLGSYGNSINYLDVLIENTDVYLATESNQIKIYNLEEFNSPHTVINSESIPKIIAKTSNILAAIEDTQTYESRLELFKID